MRRAVAGLQEGWRRRGQEIGFGVGIAQGFATLGQIGFKDRFDYSAIGTVVNTAARLSDAAADGQILVTSRVADSVRAFTELADIGPLKVKGLRDAGVVVTERIGHWVGENKHNAAYLAVKRRKMGHHPDQPVRLRALSSARRR